MSSYLERNPLQAAIEPCAPSAVHFAVIPVHDENEEIFATLASIKAALKNSLQPVAVVLVLNEPVSANAEAQKHNRELLESLQKNDGKYDGGLAIGSELFFINLLDNKLKEKFRTVGNARKAGFDGVLHQSDGKVTDKNALFFSLDADTLVSENYFSASFEYFENFPASVGAVFEFEHRYDNADEAVKTAGSRYEYYLRDYVKKLEIARSAYSFWTIGSAFVCRASGYTSCGGMRRNAAGEDFYFLQALRKVGFIGRICTAKVYPAGRLSQRVPFGTGPAIAKQLTGEELKLYNIKIFELLGKFFRDCQQMNYEVLCGNISNAAPEVLKNYLQEQNFENIWQKIVKNTPKNHRKLFEALQIYCDGFFILKFAHFLEEKYPDEFARTALPPDEELSEKLALLSE